MKDVIIIILLIFSIQISTAKLNMDSISITKNEFNLENGLRNCDIDIVNSYPKTIITIKNISEQNYYFWISRNKYDNNKDESFIIFDYLFRKPSSKYEFAFGNLMSENIVFNDYIYIIGYNFIKFLKPEEEFKIITTCNSETVEEYIAKFIFIPEKSLIINFSKIDDYFLYPFDTLLINCTEEREEHKLGTNQKAYLPSM